MFCRCLLNHLSTQMVKGGQICQVERIIAPIEYEQKTANKRPVHAANRLCHGDLWTIIDQPTAFQKDHDTASSSQKCLPQTKRYNKTGDKQSPCKSKGWCFFKCLLPQCFKCETARQIELFNIYSTRSHQDAMGSRLWGRSCIRNEKHHLSVSSVQNLIRKAEHNAVWCNAWLLSTSALVKMPDYGGQGWKAWRKLQFVGLCADLICSVVKYTMHVYLLIN